jgi:hypothetical protein
MKESLESVFFLHFTCIYTTFALRTSMDMESSDPKEQGCNPQKNAKIGNLNPIANANGNSYNRNAAELDPLRQVRELFDRIIPPFLILHVIVRGLMLEFENDPFHLHMTMRMPNSIDGTK